MRRQYFVYILGSLRTTLYTGMTNNLERRVALHRAKTVPGFTSRYNVHRLLWYDATSDVYAAISREKEIKKWRRSKKIALIKSMNPEFNDLYEDVLRGGKPDTPQTDSPPWACLVTTSAGPPGK